MTGPIVISSNLIIDDVWLADGRHAGEFAGGAALWAALGARFFWPDVAVLAGVGEDFEDIFGTIIDEFGLRRDGHLVRDARTIRSRLAYEAEDRRTETPAHGHAHFQAMQVAPADLPAALRPAAGTYVFRDLWPKFWSDLKDTRSDLGVVLWELQGDVADARHRDRVGALLSSVDAFSLNLAEARALTGQPTGLAAARELVSEGAELVAVREGENGAVIATAAGAFRVMPAPLPVVDVTGGGNAFCGGLLAGLVEDRDDIRGAARKASAAAGLCIAQYGTPARPDPNAVTDICGTVELVDVW